MWRCQSIVVVTYDDDDVRKTYVVMIEAILLNLRKYTRIVLCALEGSGRQGQEISKEAMKFLGKLT